MTSPPNKHGLSFVEYSEDKEGKEFAIAKELVECLFYDMAKLCTKYSTNNIRISYRYSPAFIIPLFCGVRELIRYNESTGTVSWIINPA